MASAELRDELNCSICLSLYTDPVSLRCGHSFCRSCIVRVLDTQDGSGGYSCPDCSAEYPERPPMEKKRKLDNTVEHFLHAHDMEATRIFCTYCTKSPLPAVKSCLQCENSLCGAHLTAHNKTMDHILAEPTSSFDNRKCPIHKKVLELYCPQDAACLCVFCCLVGEHKGHQVEPLDEASEKKKQQLRKNLDQLKTQKAEIPTRVQNLQDHERNIQEKASDKRKNISKLFMDIKEQLEMAEKKALSEISRLEEEIVSKIPHVMKTLEIEEDELSRKMCHLEEMGHVTDPIRLLQESDIPVCGHGDGGTSKVAEPVSEVASAHVSDTKVQDNTTNPKSLPQNPNQGAAYSDESMVEEEEHPFSDPDEMADDLDDVLISRTIHRSMRDIVTNVTSQLRFHVPDIVLDVDTAGGYVKLSEDLKTATQSEKKLNRPMCSGRFIYSQVMSTCGLSSGRHYFEIDWNQMGKCGIGMSYPSIKRHGNESTVGDNEKSWALILEDIGLSVRHSWDYDFLYLKPKGSTFGIFLDYEDGRLSFYELCDPIRHLHTFTAYFTEPLHVILYLEDDASVTIRS